ncbi:MAG: HdeD family acid-resistance protein [Pseudomonadota bacterium]
MTDVSQTHGPRGHEADRGADASKETKDAAFQAGKAVAHNRWLLLIVGTITVLAGVAAIAMPFLASLAAAVIVAWALILSGGVGLFTAFRRHDGWHIASSFALSVLSILGGILILSQPIAGLFALTTILIAFFAAAGILKIYYGVQSWGDGGGWMVALGVVSVLFAALLWFEPPFNAAWLPGVVLAVDLILWGALQIALAIRIGRETAETTSIQAH